MSTTPTTLTQRELQILAVVVKTAKVPLQPDHKAIVDLGHFKNTNSSSASWWQLKRKLATIDVSAAAFAMTSTTTATTVGATSTPKKVCARAPCKRTAQAITTGTFWLESNQTNAVIVHDNISEGCEHLTKRVKIATDDDTGGEDKGKSTIKDDEDTMNTILDYEGRAVIEKAEAVLMETAENKEQEVDNNISQE